MVDLSSSLGLKTMIGSELNSFFSYLESLKFVNELLAYLTHRNLKNFDPLITNICDCPLKSLQLSKNLC